MMSFSGIQSSQPFNLTTWVLLLLVIASEVIPRGKALPLSETTTTANIVHNKTIINDSAETSEEKVHPNNVPENVTAVAADGTLGKKEQSSSVSSLEVTNEVLYGFEGLLHVSNQSENMQNSSETLSSDDIAGLSLEGSETQAHGLDSDQDLNKTTVEETIIEDAGSGDNGSGWGAKLFSTLEGWFIHSNSNSTGEDDNDDLRSNETVVPLDKNKKPWRTDAKGAEINALLFA